MAHGQLFGHHRVGPIQLAVRVVAAYPRTCYRGDQPVGNPPVGVTNTAERDFHNAMKVLITGAGGQVGHELQACRWPVDALTVALGHDDLDIANHRQVAEQLAPPLDAVVNLAAYTAVDRAEDEREYAWRANAEGPAVLAKRCAELEIPLIHLSTDYVFDGRKARPYIEDDLTRPLNHYGASKLRGEEAVRARSSRHIILRTASVFGEFGQNFVKLMLRLGVERSSFGVVSDQVSCPTPARDIATAIVRIIERLAGAPHSEPWGVYHFCGRPSVTRFRLAQEIFKIASLRGRPVPELHAITAAEYPRAAQRPAFSAMNCGKIQQTFNIAAPSWADALPQVVSALLDQEESL